MQGALIAASAHALAKALLFICLAAPDADGALKGEPVALATRYPVSAFGFLFGMLAMLGVPPTFGYIGRWRLYASALHIGPCPLAIFILSSILALVAYTLALCRNWWDRARVRPQGPAASHSPSRPCFVVLVIVIVAARPVARRAAIADGGHTMKLWEPLAVLRPPPQPLDLPHERRELQRLRH